MPVSSFFLLGTGGTGCSDLLVRINDGVAATPFTALQTRLTLRTAP